MEKSLKFHHLGTIARTILSGCILATKAYINNRKRLNSNISSTYAHNMAIFSPLTAEISLPVSGTPANLASTSFTGGQPNFARSLAVSWAGTQCIHFQGLLPSDGILSRAKFTLPPSPAFSYIGCVTVYHPSSGRQPHFATWYKERNYGTFAEGATYFGRAQPSRWTSAHILVCK